MKSKVISRRSLFLPIFMTMVILVSLVSFNIPAVAAVYYDYTYYEGDDQGESVNSGLAELISGLDMVKFDSSGNPYGDADGVTVNLAGTFPISWSST